MGQTHKIVYENKCNVNQRKLMNLFRQETIFGTEFDLKCTRHNVFHGKIERDHKEITAKDSQSVFRRSLFGLQFLDLWLLILFFEVKT